jgi:hypothetical protein
MKSHHSKAIRKVTAALLATLLPAVVFSVPVLAAKAQVDKKAAVKKVQRGVSSRQAVDTSPAGGVPAFEDLGVDLVVSKVVIRRGTFHDGKTIRVTPYVRNMCNGTTSRRIKILYDGLEKAVWIEGGIRSKTERAGPTIYLHENEDGGLNPFAAVVDNMNEVPENNDGNNTCSGITFRGTDTSRTHTCPIVGATCHDAPRPHMEREMETRPR